MLKKYHKYWTFFLTLATLLNAQDLIIEKESEGIYTANFGKGFVVGEKLSINIHDYTGNIIINGTGTNELRINETCSFKSYSEKDAELKYYKSKIGFILNNDKLEIDGKRGGNKFDAVLDLRVPDFTNISIFAHDSEIAIIQTDGEISIIGSDTQVVMNKVSSKVKIKGKSLDVNITDCSLVGDIILSRGMLTISKLKSEYFNATLFGADLDASDIDSKVVFKTTGGDIFIEESQNDAKLYSSGGDITVEKIDGNIFCDTKGGNVDLGVVAGLCKINCVSGEISIEEAQDNLNIIGINTEIDVEKALGSVVIENNNKDIKVYKSTIGEEFSVMIKNQNGDIDLYLDSEIRADINAKIEYAYGYANDFEIESEFTLENHKSERNGRTGYISRYGSINGGGATIILKNKNGDIYIYEE